MTTNEAAQGVAEKFPKLAKTTGSAPVTVASDITSLDKAGYVQVPKIDADGALTGDSEQLDIMHVPDPVGHFMLVALPDVEIKTKSGIYIPETVTDRERAASVVGTVLAMGPDCYVDPAPKVPLSAVATGQPVIVIAPAPRFPSGPWCKVGDTVLFSRYAGKRFKSGGVEFRMLNDDEISATVPLGAKVGGL